MRVIVKGNKQLWLDPRIIRIDPRITLINTNYKKRFSDAGEKKIFNPVISILPEAEEKSFHLQSPKISQSLTLLRNDEVVNCEK